MTGNERLARAVLLFHCNGVWTEDNRAEWEAMPARARRRQSRCAISPARSSPTSRHGTDGEAQQSHGGCPGGRLGRRGMAGMHTDARGSQPVVMASMSRRSAAARGLLTLPENTSDAVTGLP